MSESSEVTEGIVVFVLLVVGRRCCNVDIKCCPCEAVRIVVIIREQQTTNDDESDREVDYCLEMQVEARDWEGRVTTWAPP